MKNASTASMTSLGDESKSSGKLAVTNSPATSHKSLGTFGDTGDGNSSSDIEEFKDVDPSEEKFFGSELYDELPIEERKVKYQETVEYSKKHLPKKRFPKIYLSISQQSK